MIIHPCKICKTESQSVYCSPECRIKGGHEVGRIAEARARKREKNNQQNEKI